MLHACCISGVAHNWHDDREKKARSVLILSSTRKIRIINLQPRGSKCCTYDMYVTHPTHPFLQSRAASRTLPLLRTEILADSEALSLGSKRLFFQFAIGGSGPPTPHTDRCGLPPQTNDVAIRSSRPWDLFCLSVPSPTHREVPQAVWFGSIWQIERG